MSCFTTSNIYTGPKNQQAWGIIATFCFSSSYCFFIGQIIEMNIRKEKKKDREKKSNSSTCGRYGLISIGSNVGFLYIY